ncbi:MAG TPA: hypothetical protein VJ731_13590 [Terriglobales bacterium]|jgi:hypothetical protein|nr:hypothetical protein [Terriglobales bacterium]
MAGRTFVITFTLNVAWEMGQMSLYRGMKPLSPHSVMFCSLASVADAGYTLFLLWIGRRILRNSRRALLLTAFRIVYIAGSGVITSVIVERVGLRAGLWAYNSAMPKSPWLCVGILPVLQLAFLPLLTFYVVRRFSFLPGAQNRL